MFSSFSSSQVLAGVLAEQKRGWDELAALCGLEPGRSVESCGRRWCTYFDEERSRCALVEWDVHARLGSGALSWFATHRGTKPLPQDATTEALAMRVGAL